MYSQDSKDKALGMLRLTGDVEKTAKMSGVPGRTLRRWAAAAAKPRQRSRGAKFEPYGDEVRSKAMEMARGGASCREIAEARMGGRSRKPEGDEPAYAGFGGGPEERIRQLELENDILRGGHRPFKSREPRCDEQHGEDRADRQVEAGDRPPLKRAHRFLEDLEELL
ncbi:hypothetical protein [Bifidobacterium angulatum]|uniref:hypothetical protein n=1 Tax=Bifidobacterium angulatum TaxID=1683 RepID=UPI0005F9344C|nr:hypothetical protein [Bifidobacterium angulatum]AMK58267.1 hypothetical protein Bang102_007200 [Bifidobacterium angulatum]